MSDEIRITYDTQNRIEYVMKAKPGSKTTESVWRLFRLEYLGISDNIIRVGYANNDSSYAFKASDYLYYKYTPEYKTTIKPLINLPAGTIFDFLTPDSTYEILGDTPDLLSTEEQFNSVDFIHVFNNKNRLVRGLEAKWISATQLKLNVACVAYEGITLES